MEQKNMKQIRLITPTSYHEVNVSEAMVEFVIDDMVRRYRFDKNTQSLILDKDWYKDEKN